MSATSFFSLNPVSLTDRPVRTLHKGRQTKAAIVDAALGIAQRVGLEGLSIGVVSEAMEMSKSGVFAHFGSREELQIAVLRAYFERFEREVFSPILSHPRGLPRLTRLFDLWMERVAIEIDSGCIFISGAVEFDDRPGPVREALAESVEVWLAAMTRTISQAKREGHLKADADAKQIAFEIHGLILALHFEARFLKWPKSQQRACTGFKNILRRYGSAASPTQV